MLSRRRHAVRCPEGFVEIGSTLRSIHEMSTRSLVTVILICGFTSLSLAQAPPAPPKPGPEHKKLEYFVGNGLWKTRLKPTSLCRRVRLSPPQQLHWGRGDSM